MAVDEDDVLMPCTSVKLGCDGHNPCKTCKDKGLDCKYSRLEKLPSKEQLKPADSQSSDIGSIKFLLNHGTASFIECFSFPPSNERTSSSQAENPEPSYMVNFQEGDNYSFMLDPLENESIDMSVFDDENLIKFLSSPFNQTHQSDDIYASIFLDQSFDPAIDAVEWEAPSAASTAMIQSVISKAYALQINAEELDTISRQSNFLFAPSRLQRLKNQYFETWHRNCPILHQASFDLDTAPTPLLLSITLIGALYSQVDQEASAARTLLDIAEMHVYSIEDLTEEFEVRQTMRVSGSESVLSPLALPHLQAAYLMICAQFWGGNKAARKRAVELRFAVVVKIARKMGLNKARHSYNVDVDERLFNIMTSLDCAFSFFSNFPCRLTLSELQCDLVCDQTTFASSHPFSEPGSRLSRRLTLIEAFQALFGRKSSLQKTEADQVELNVMDLFILIHLLYVYTQVQIMLFASSPVPKPPPDDAKPFDTSLAHIKTALLRWRNMWTHLRNRTPVRIWNTLGFFNNAYNYWLVTQLLINNKSSASVLMGMEVNCEDALARLRALLRESGND
ncbi:hypothetical protein BP5796_01772 [Coleophoma crateriformis]|uniref:Xylanolytic transcriptional activator regulatory domain-containing protein n=1 Tax=Coleophoma crateriformis TaxID=565419 RepID=A0A3D8T300_9HELO|nr:hypothetical protein BP5796_01772 [Coleophoma crateriformis]